MDEIIIIDKPKGYTSHDVVNVVKKNIKHFKSRPYRNFRS